MSEFSHYGNHRPGTDMENCSACVLECSGEEGPNYAGWPLSFIKNGRSIPFKYRKALANELKRTDNPAYVKNLKTQLTAIGFKWEGLL